MKKLLLALMIVSIPAMAGTDKQADDFSKYGTINAEQYTNAYCTGYVQSFSESNKFGAAQNEASAALNFFYNQTANDDVDDGPNGGKDSESLDKAFENGYNDYTAAKDKSILMPKVCAKPYFAFIQGIYDKAKDY